MSKSIYDFNTSSDTGKSLYLLDNTSGSQTSQSLSGFISQIQVSNVSSTLPGVGTDVVLDKLTVITLNAQDTVTTTLLVEQTLTYGNILLISAGAEGADTFTNITTLGDTNLRINNGSDDNNNNYILIGPTNIILSGQSLTVKSDQTRFYDPVLTHGYFVQGLDPTPTGFLSYGLDFPYIPFLGGSTKLGFMGYAKQKDRFVFYNDAFYSSNSQVNRISNTVNSFDLDIIYTNTIRSADDTTTSKILINSLSDMDIIVNNDMLINTTNLNFGTNTGTNKLDNFITYTKLTNLIQSIQGSNTFISETDTSIQSETTNIELRTNTVNSNSYIRFFTDKIQQFSSDNIFIRAGTQSVPVGTFSQDLYMDANNDVIIKALNGSITNTVTSSGNTSILTQSGDNINIDMGVSSLIVSKQSGIIPNSIYPSVGGSETWDLGKATNHYSFMYVDNLGSDIDLNGNIVSNAEIQGSTFSGATIINSNMRNVGIVGSTISSSGIAGSTMINMIMTNSGITGSTMRFNIITDSFISNTAITGSTMRDMVITNSGITGSTMRFNIVTDSFIHNSAITGSTMRDMVITNSGITGSTMRDMVITNSGITGSTMRDMVITNSGITGSTMRDMVITNSGITGSTMRFNILTDSFIHNSAITGSTMRDIVITNSGITGSTLLGVTITGSTIFGTTMTSISITGSTMFDSTIVGGTITGSTISGTTMTSISITGSTMFDSTIVGGTVIGNTMSLISITGSTMFDSTIVGGTVIGNTMSLISITGSTMFDSTIVGGTVIGNTMSLISITGSTMFDSTIVGGTVIGNTMSLISITGSTMFDSTIVGGTVIGNTMSLISITGSTMFDSTIVGGTVIGNTMSLISITGSTMFDSTIVGGTVIGNTMSLISITGSTMFDSTIVGGTVIGNTMSLISITGSTMFDSTIVGGTVIGNTMSLITIIGSTITGSTVTGSTFATSVPITAINNQLILGTLTTITINSPPPAASQTYEIPDTGTGSTFVMSDLSKFSSTNITTNPLGATYNLITPFNVFTGTTGTNAYPFKLPSTTNNTGRFFLVKNQSGLNLNIEVNNTATETINQTGVTLGLSDNNLLIIYCTNANNWESGRMIE